MQAAGGGGGGGGATVPRNFKLLDELEEAERSIKGGADVSLGLAGDDPSLSSWNCSIFAQAGGGEPRMWSLSLYCDKDYPAKPPTIKFSSKVAMDCVDAKGNVRRRRRVRGACEARARRDEPLGPLARSLAQAMPSLSRARAARAACSRARLRAFARHSLALRLDLLLTGHLSAQVVAAKVPYLASWNPSKTLLGACNELKGLIARASRQQPPDGAQF